MTNVEILNNMNSFCLGIVSGILFTIWQYNEHLYSKPDPVWNVVWDSDITLPPAIPQEPIILLSLALTVVILCSAFVYFKGDVNNG